MSRFQRRGGAGEAQRATTLELFYDLVFVFAITQVSHLLIAILIGVIVADSVAGARRAAASAGTPS